jgi:glycosyltransferase involved in cell wall biosynthesis
VRVNGDGKRPGLSGVVVAMNEEDRIGDCLASLDFCDEILVVDSHSTDRTREVAARHGARVIERDWPGFVEQKDFAARAAAHEWVLALDSDERISPALRAEIVALRERGFPGMSGWRMPRLSSYLGRAIRHGTWYPDLQLRLFDRRRGGWTGRDPHDRVDLEGPVGRLRADLLHHPYRSFEEHLATIDRYTTIMAEQLEKRGRRVRLRDIALRPPARFVAFYLVKRGFLDGWRGLLMAYLAAHYVRLKYAKLYVRQRLADAEDQVWSETSSR